MSSTRRPLHALPPTETLDLGIGGLSLSPRLRLRLTFFRSDPYVKPIDEWQLKRSLLDFLRESLSLAIPDDDLIIRKRADLHKRKRDEPVASGTLYVRDLGFLKKKMNYWKDRNGEGEEEDEEILRSKFMEWRDSVIGRMDGIELNLEGVKFRLSVEVPASDDFNLLQKAWEDFYALQSSGNRYSSRGIIRRPDTIVVKGVPSRWFAELRVSSKPSMLVTHTVFSVLGKIRNLNVAGDDDLGKTTKEDKGDIVSGLQCTVWVQFENYEDFCNATKVLCGRSMQKQGSRLKADYEVTWDRDGFFRNIQQTTARSRIQESGSHTQLMAGHFRRDTSRLQSDVTRFDSDGAPPKRFRSPNYSCLISIIEIRELPVEVYPLPKSSRTVITSSLWFWA